MVITVLLILTSVILFIASLMIVSGHESRQEEQRAPLPPAYGLPCSVCGVVESAHWRMSSHPFSF